MDWRNLKTLLETIDGEWKLAILVNLRQGPMRFGNLQRTINTQVEPGHVSDKSLRDTLKSLQAGGLVHRRDLGLFWRDGVEYSLTDWACRLLQPLDGLDAWYAEEMRLRRARMTGADGDPPAAEAEDDTA